MARRKKVRKKKEVMTNRLEIFRRAQSPWNRNFYWKSTRRAYVDDEGKVILNAGHLEEDGVMPLARWLAYWGEQVTQDTKL